jgi:hypothetical protein
MTSAEQRLSDTADNTILSAAFEPTNLDGFFDRAELLKLARVYGYLAAYAEDKAKAMELRVAGDIEAALQYEKACERSYNKLPAWAKW